MSLRGTAGALAAVVLLALPAAAAGHAEERAAEVGARQVRVVVSSPVEQAFLELGAVDASGRPVTGPARRDPLNSRAIVAPLTVPAPGPVAVRWRALSQDGHASGEGPGAPGGDGLLAVAARLLLLAAPVGMLGLAVLAGWVVAPALARGGIAPPGRPPGEAQGFRERAGAALNGRAGAWWAAWWALACGGALGLTLLPVALLRGLGEGAGGLGTLLGDTRAGAAWWAQAGALAAAVAAGLALRRRGLPAGAAALVLGLPPAVALAAISWGGHASGGADRTANIAIDLLHNLATAAWLGGLLGLALVALPAVRALDAGDRVRLGAGVVVRFSALALTAVGVLVVTGVYRALAELGPVAEIADSDYGIALLVKLAIFAVLLLGGAYNRLVAHPRLERAALGLDPGDRGAAAALRASVAAELALAGALMVSVAVLVSLPPPG